MNIFSTNKSSNKTEYYSAQGIHAGAKAAVTGYALSSIIDLFNPQPSKAIKKISVFAKNYGKFGLAISIASGTIFLGANLCKNA